MPTGAFSNASCECEPRAGHKLLASSSTSQSVSYYWEHKETLDADIERRTAFAEKSRQEAGPSPLATRLREQRVLPKPESELRFRSPHLIRD